jgi:hypothetical protein
MDTGRDVEINMDMDWTWLRTGTWIMSMSMSMPMLIFMSMCQSSSSPCLYLCVCVRVLFANSHFNRFTSQLRLTVYFHTLSRSFDKLIHISSGGFIPFVLGLAVC